MSDTEKYLAAVEERDKDVTDKRNRLFEDVGEDELLVRAKEEEVATSTSQADVRTLLEIVEEAQVHLEVMHDLNELADHECFIRGADLCIEHMNRIARAAMEKRHAK